ncbi:MAG: aldehyde dehydrogenase, partial [Rhodobiaceae bacterium]|nr:aldehyde dehydrogenase [Rhodobiaceae bacterium]
ASGETIACIDPSTARCVGHFSRGGAADVDAAVAAARAAFEGPWRDFTPQQRGNLMMDLAAAIEAHRDLLARLEALDVGKPIGDAHGDVGGAVATLRYNAGAADKLEGATIPLGGGFVDYTELEPLGVTAHITPWNYPLGMAIRSLAPALAAGCTAVLKPAEQTSLTTLALAEIVLKTGIPAGVVNVVTGYGAEAGAPLVKHPDVDGVTFTGSVATGRKIGAMAGETLKPVVLELGGKNPMIVFDDADLGRAVDVAMEGVFDNCGQVCSSVSRLILQAGIKDRFLDRFVARAKEIRVGPAMDNPNIGPLVSAEQLEKVRGHIASARASGATMLLGGGASDGPGYFVAPTVFSDVDPDSAIATEETFGPVVTAYTFETEDEAVALANRLRYGLVAGVHTRDIDRALRLSRRLQAGSVWINGWFIGGVQAPTGGIKDSGVGRERGLPGIHNYLNIKTIGISVAPAAPTGG